MAGTCDILIRGGTVIDGTGSPGVRGDVAVTGDRILAVGPALAHRAPRVIEAAGLVVAPGFIDVHTHDDRALLSHPLMPFKVSQGVTTLVAGDCGALRHPVTDRFDRKGRDCRHGRDRRCGTGRGVDRVCRRSRLPGGRGGIVRRGSGACRAGWASGRAASRRRRS
ncbi:MAG: amidohydrolase family protein [Gemmobacter sp.]